MAVTPQVAISDSFLTALAKLPKATQKKVREFTSKFRANPTSAAINYESLHGMRDPKVRTVRIDLAYRAVVVHPPNGDVYLLVWVDHHDEAMAWAKDNVFDVNASTGVIQVLDMEEVPRAVDAVAIDAEPAKHAPRGLFAALNDEALAQTGLPAVLLPAVRAVVDEEQLDKLQPYLPQEAFEALFLVACGYELERAVRESSRPSVVPQPKPVDPTDFAAALERPATRRQFKLVGSEDELLEMLDASLDRWRVFLHPNQDVIVRTNFRGPARVLGGAGTGKTVVAMHRARHLARLYPDAKVLFTTFNRNLATNIAGLLDTLCTAAERERIDVTNIHSWAVGYAGRHWGNVTVVGPEQSRECWDAALAGRSALGWTRLDYESEWNDVVQFHGVTGRDEYLKASRAGCAKALKRAERAQIWEGLAAYRAELDRRRLCEWTDVVRRVRQDVQCTGEHPYRAIVIDEAQDLDAEQWRLLRVLTPNEDNSLFITGDAHQRIYGRPITLSQFGIAIRGRSHRLKVNYRTTEQILRWARKLLETEEIDDLDGGTDNCAGYRSLYVGPEPDVQVTASDEMERGLIVKRVQDLLKQSPAAEIAVISRLKSRVRAHAQALAEAGIASAMLDSDGTVGEGVRCATMHRVKGLEFTDVIVAMDRANPSTDPRELSLLYVAATRCRKTLTVLKRGVT